MTEFKDIVQTINKSNKFYKNTLARLGAMQVIYMMQSSKCDLSTAQENICQFMIETSEENDAVELPNFELFEKVSEGVYTHLDDLLHLLKENLPAHKDFHLIDEVQKFLLLCGIYELQHMGESDKGIIINDYINLTKAFYHGQEYRLTNAFLDAIGKKLR